MTKITNAIALSIALENLSSIPTLYSEFGVNQISDEERTAVFEHLEKMLESIVKRAKTAKTRERKPTAKEIAAKAESAELAIQTFTKMSENPNFLYECKPLAETMGVSVPKMARVLASLVSDGKVERIEGKKPNFKVKGE